MRDKTACFTGHRKIASEQQRIVAERLKQTVEKLILNGYCYFGAGGAVYERGQFLVIGAALP